MSEAVDPKQMMARKTAFEIVEDVFHDGDLNADTTFTSLGMDSLSKVSLEMEVERALELPDYVVKLDENVKTVADLADFIEARL
jgi:acyl carrier protein